MPRNKNFYRYELLKLAEIHGDEPLVFTAIYKHADHSEWVTLSTLRLLDQSHSKAICSHINLLREEVDKHLVLDQGAHQRKVCFLAKITSYRHYGSIRGGISLHPTDVNHSPIWFAKPSAEENHAYAAQLKDMLKS